MLTVSGQFARRDFMTDERLSLEQIHIIKNSLTALRKNKIDHVPIGEAIQFIIYSIWRDLKES